MNFRLRFLLLAILPLFYSTLPVQGKSPLRIFAAASTRQPLDRALNAFEKKSGYSVTAVYGPSETLALQLSQGAVADLFLSADVASGEFLARELGIASAALVPFLTNELVFIRHREASVSVRVDPAFPIENSFTGRMAIADPNTVPAGKYALAALEKLGWAGRLSGRLVHGLDVRVTLSYVDRGEAEVGIVYKTDVQVASGVVPLAPIPRELHPPVVYLLMRLGTSEVAGQLCAFLRSPEGFIEFEKFGFRPPLSP